MATVNQAIGTQVIPAVTALQSLANSVTVGWKSAIQDLRTTLPLDVEIFVKLTTAATAPANDKAMYVWICPAYHDGTVWNYADGGTTTLPTDGDATYTIAQPNDLVLLDTLSYTVTSEVVQKTMQFSSKFGSMPDGFIVIITNFSGAALSTGCVVAYRPINQTVV